MIYPATLDVKILQNATFRLVLRVLNNAKEITSLTVNSGTPVFERKCHKLAAGTKVVFLPPSVNAIHYSDTASNINPDFDTPCGLDTNTVYFVSSTNLTSNSFTVSATSGGAPITVSGELLGKLDVAEVVDLTGYTIDSDIYSLLTNELVGSFTSTIVTAVDGLVQLLLQPSAALALDTGRYGYDVNLTSGGGERYYWLKGVATVEQTYSRA